MSNIKLNSNFKTVCIASDHAGYNLKEVIKNHLIVKMFSSLIWALLMMILLIIPIMLKNCKWIKLKKSDQVFNMWFWYRNGHKCQ